ncbi:aromatase/cyclase [Streptomyces sp. 5-8]|uniref:Aromatase/cyclase n=1 Tax=Streptomyces musisoli TaxID=2802280 RepID=A0ABS1P3D1_9ACTN|nr:MULTISPECIES: aromatase/cyclase [Streptomyces]MBL1106857.1 aromatase/cyclase [Streptomyces musisoli]MBY8844844.1 aromatase/cyclase [Streptomyces sp. SP2-10]
MTAPEDPLIERTAVSKPESHVVERSITVRAPADAVYQLVVDVERWPQLIRSVAHIERTAHGAASDEVRVWAVRGHDQAASWTSYRDLDHEARTVAFRNDPPAGPTASSGGEWRVREGADGTSELTVRHTFVLADGVPAAAAAEVSAGVGQHAEAQLGELAYAAEHREELAELTISFEDPLFIGGTAEDSYALLYRAREWPDRFPHVTRIDMTEDERGIQFFDMDTLTPDGRAHTTRSVRVCMPHHKIVYKQISLAPLLTAHTGHWLFTETPEGVVASARHTATINPDALDLLFPGATVQDARAYLRKALSANSVSNLRFAKEYAEELAERRARERAESRARETARA